MIIFSRPFIFFKRFLFLFFILLSSLKIKAQYSIGDSIITFPMIGATFAYQFPGGDIVERFGNNYNVGSVFQWKLRKNWIIGIEGNFLFGEEVKERNILDKYFTPDGNIINGNGQFGTVSLSERGIKIEMKGGKIIPVIGPNKNSGLLTTIGIGYLQHKILIETPDSPIPYLEGEYRKGYDRLTSGLSISEFIGYINFSNRKLINFYTGFEFTQAFTKNRRVLNFDTGQSDTNSRIDLLTGFRIGWVFPIYKQIADKIYFN